MHEFCTRHRLPVGGVDAIDDPVTAVRFLRAITDRSTPSTVTLLLDEQRRGLTIVHLTDVHHDDAVLLSATHVTEQMTHHVDLASVIVASVRPGGCDQLDDIDRWCELDARYAAAGIQLVEWFILAASVSTPRSLLGEPPRWRSSP